jgi:hypothetical protein
MPRRAATITQADIARVVRAAKQAGAAEVELRLSEHSTIVIRLGPSTGGQQGLEQTAAIVL